MPRITYRTNIMRVSTFGLVVAGLLCLGLASCQSPHEPTHRAEPNIDPGAPRGNRMFTQVSYQEVRAALPTIEGAEYVNDDEICQTCHGAYANAFAAHNVHRAEGCEACHGPASKHVEARGKEPGLIFSFKKGDPVVLAEACLRCHEENQCTEGAQWRRSKHAHCGVTCVTCHRGHYDVQPGTAATTEPQVNNMRGAAGNIAMTNYQIHARQPGQEPIKKNLPSLRGTSNHLGAMAPGTCFRCHTEMQDLAKIAGPHQIGGPNGFNCTSCHDPHGRILEYSRKDLCLSCHTDAPTMAFHSSIHDHNGVACTDCHNPHPRACVPQVVDISHWQVKRPMRLAMSVQQPETCYKCHPKIYGLNALPSHHPVKEGKIVCTDCHDPHGQEADNLKEATINLVCYKCHAEKQGPFAFEHPPVRENCTICHEPHGTVANNLLRQPPTFLCLRCHPGHYSGSRHPQSGSNFLGTDVDASQRRAMFTDCTQCHAQVHGTNRISQRSDPYFTR